MILVAWLVVGILAIVAVGAIVWSAGSRSEAQLSAVRQEMQNSLAAQSQNVTSQINAQIGQLAQSVTQQLGQVRQELQTGVATTGQLTSDAQREVARRLQSSTDMLLQMSERIGEMQQASQDLSKTTSTLQAILSGVKTRGALGETMLDNLLSDALPQSAYATQYRFASTGSIVDAIVRSGDRLLCIDSKFPLEAYQRLVESGEEARRDFSVAVRKHADSIAEKYILPHENTFDYALMYVPSEGVYYELVTAEDSKYESLDKYCRSRRVYPVSPNLLCAFINAVAISLQGQKFEENARHLFAGLAGLKKQIESFGDAYDKLGVHLRNAQRNYEDAGVRLNKVTNAIEKMSQGALPEAEPVQQVLLPPSEE
ncbi:MAG TPA: DNA recombination protein RmuC [Candidatus Baltobacteraceae bacterium]|jgi:DNA recombination protein RmuC|nr:DNA recombination protein RmuC [Candidatus Baltobacteraceae bacterium]